MTGSPHLALAPADDPAARAAWAVLLNACPTARVHADPRWLDVVARAFRAPGAFALARDLSGAVSAGVAGYYSRTLRGARVFHSLRHGVLTREPAMLGPLLAAVEAECRSRGCAQAVLGGAPEALPGPYRASTQTTLTLDLEGGAESLWDGFGNKVRNTIRRAERNGLEVSRDLAHLSGFHAIYARTMTERRASVRALPFFRAIFDVFGGDARLYSAIAAGRSCGAMLVVSTGGYAAYPFGAFDEQGRHQGANTLLLWHVARDLAGERISSLDLGPSKPDSGAFRFKLHVGGVPQTLHYIDLLRPAQSASASDTPARQPAAPGPLDRTIEQLPFALRVQVRTWLGRTGRLL
jgi:hypothetical protein